MSSIRSTGTKIERQLRSALWRRGLRFRKNYSKLLGKPDIVFTRRRLAVFCDSDFWHGRDWERLKQRLTTNSGYWVPKIERNRKRDHEVNTKLATEGWRVLRIWESDIKHNLDECVALVQAALDESQPRRDGAAAPSSRVSHPPQTSS